MPGTAPQGWQAPKTSYSADDVLTPEQFERIEGNDYATELGNRTIDPTQAPTGVVGTLRQLLDWFANRVKAILGTADWHDAPPTTLTAAKSHIDAAAPHTGHLGLTEFNAKFHATTGHKHTGEAGEGPTLPYGARTTDLSDVARHARGRSQDDAPVTLVNVVGPGMLLRADMWGRSDSSTMEINVDGQGWVSIPWISWRAGSSATTYNTYSFTVPPIFFSTSFQLRVKFWNVHKDDRCAAVAWTKVF